MVPELKNLLLVVRNLFLGFVGTHVLQHEFLDFDFVVSELLALLRVFFCESLHFLLQALFPFSVLFAHFLQNCV